MSEFEKWWEVESWPYFEDADIEDACLRGAKAAWNHQQKTIDELKARIAELLDAAKDVSKNIRAQNEWDVMPLSRLDAAISKYEQQS